MLPLLFVGALFAVHVILRPATVPTVKEITGAVFETQRRGRPCLERLAEILRSGYEPEMWVVDEAVTEAYDRGDYRTVIKLHDRFYCPESLEEGEGDEMEGGEVESPESTESPPVQGESEEQPLTDQDFIEAAENADRSDTVIGRVSPFKGVPDESWDRFVDSLATQEETYQGPKHIGRFHHSRERLSQLKIDDVSTADKQYEALVADLKDAREKSNSLINEFEFRSISIDGVDHTITLSGLLAVIKSAGMENARSWFVNQSDRTKFPKTTEIFSKANGAF